MILQEKIIGDRIILSSLSEKNIDHKYQSWLSDPEVNQYLEARHRPWSLEDIRQYVADQNSSKDSYLLGIFIDDNHVGNIRLGSIDNLHALGTISLLIGDKDYWGKGIATEAISLVRDFAISDLNIKKLVAGMYSDNIGSFRAFQRAGFSLEGILKSHYEGKLGKRVDLLQVGLVC